MNPTVSVIIPCYNHEQYIQACIQSIIGQTYPDIELIIIDDGSKDRSVEKIRELEAQCRQRFVRYRFLHRANRGLSATLNEALALSSGTYVCFIASDDLMYPEKTTQQAAYLERHPDVAAVFGHVDLIDESGRITGELLAGQTEYSFSEILTSRHCYLAPTQMYRRSLFEAVGGFDEQVKIEDWDLLLRISRNGSRMANLPAKLCQYRQHGHNISKNWLLMYEEKKKILHKYPSDPHFREGCLINELERLNAEFSGLTDLKSENYLQYKIRKIQLKIRKALLKARFRIKL